MKRKLKFWLERYFSGFAPYQIVVGGMRYYKATKENYHDPEDFLYYGRNVSIKSGVSLLAPERLHLGDNVGIGADCWISAVGGCHIGRGCQIASGTIILTVEHQYTGGESLPYDSVRLVKPVYIEDYVWIGMRASIGPGVRIGEGAIVGLGSIVLQDVPPLAIVVGNPAQVLTYRSRSDFERLKEAGTHIDPYSDLPLLKVPPITKRKYKKELSGFGFDITTGKEYFYYNRSRTGVERLVALDTKDGKPILP